MLNDPNACENTTKNIYDGVREYCKAEQVDEEYFRSCLRKRKRTGSMKKAIFILIVFGGILTAAFLSMNGKTERELKDLKVYEVNMNEIEDGIYRGKAETTLVKAEVAVEVRDHEIVQIDLLKHDNGFGKKAERITGDMIAQNTCEVDAVSGATTSSRVIQSAVSAALANGKNNKTNGERFGFMNPIQIREYK